MKITCNIIRCALCAAVSLTLVSCHDIEGSTANREDEVVLPEPSDTWLLHSFDKISDYAGCPPANRAEIILMRNENEHLQLVVATAGNEPLDIERDGKPDAVEFRCREVKSFGVLEDDVLVPCGDRIRPEKNILKVWLSFKALSDAPAGTHTEVIRFRNSKCEYAVAVDVTVVDAGLPETPAIPSVFGINPDNIMLDGLTGLQKIEARKKVSDLLLEYRVSPYFSTWISGTMKTECSSSPYPWDDDRTWEYLKDPRFVRVALPFHGLDDMQLGAMLARADAEGILDKAFFYVWDEPTVQAEYDQIRAMGDRLHGYSEKAEIITTFYCGKDKSDDIFGVFDILDGATDIFCTGVWSLQSNEARSEMCRAKLKNGQEWWQYVCMSDYPGLAFNSSGIANRALMWRCWKERATGFLYWVVNSFSSMKPLKPRADLPDGDGILVYPGEPFGVDEPCVSVRLERWRDGVEDYDMLEMYAMKNGREAAEALLQNVYKTPSSFTDNLKYVTALHNRLVRGY